MSYSGNLFQLSIYFIIAFVLSIIITPLAIIYLKRRARQTISLDAPERHRKKQGTPTMGGLAIIGSVLLCSLIYHKIEIIPMVLTAIGFGALGFLDDYLIAKRGKALGLKARQKLLGQFILAIGFAVWVYMAGYPTAISLKYGGNYLDLGWGYYIYAVLLIVWMSNATNLSDGLDGLASGLSAITSTGMVVTAVSMQAIYPALIVISPEVNTAAIVFGAAMAGACLGFLWYNTHPARIFMGDTGSLMLGASIAVLAIVFKLEILILVYGFVFVAEALSVVIQVISFKTTRKRVFKMTPIHHHFELSGWHESKVVVRFWIVGLLAAVTGILLALR